MSNNSSSTSLPKDHLLQIRAGKCTTTITDGKYTVTSSATKGFLTLKQIQPKTGDLDLHLQWRERSKQENEDDHKIAVGSQRLCVVDTGNVNESVYVLRSDRNNEYHFFWIQESDASKGLSTMNQIKEIVETGEIPSELLATSNSSAQANSAANISGNDVASILRNLGLNTDSTPVAASSSSIDANQRSSTTLDEPTSTTSATDASTAGTTSTEIAEPVSSTTVGGEDDVDLDDEEAMLCAALAASMEDDGGEGREDNVDLDDEEAMLYAALAASTNDEGTATTTTTTTFDDPTPPTASSPDPISPEALAALMSGMIMAQPTHIQAAIQPAKIIPIDKILDGGSIRIFLEEHPDSIDELTQFLPPTRQTSDEVYKTLSAPQLYSAMRALSSALMSDGNFNSIFANFGLNPSDGMAQLTRGNGIGAFLDALQKKADRTNTNDK